MAKRDSRWLSGERILPSPIRRGTSLVDLVEDSFCAYNGARLREGCRRNGRRQRADHHKHRYRRVTNSESHWLFCGRVEGIRSYNLDKQVFIPPLFLGSHPADFLITRPTPQGAPIEMIDDGTSYAAWLEGVQLLHATTAQKLRRRFGRAALILFSQR